MPTPCRADGVTRSGLVGWAIACEDIDRAHNEALAAGYDPGDVIDGHRLTPDGTMLRWQATSSARTAGVVLFLISWGNTAPGCNRTVRTPTGIAAHRTPGPRIDRPRAASARH